MKMNCRKNKKEKPPGGSPRGLQKKTQIMESESVNSPIFRFDSLLSKRGWWKMSQYLDYIRSVKDYDYKRQTIKIDFLMIDNMLLECLYQMKLSGPLFKIMIYLIRRTHGETGMNKKGDWLPHTIKSQREVARYIVWQPLWRHGILSAPSFLLSDKQTKHQFDLIFAKMSG